MPRPQRSPWGALGLLLAGVALIALVLVTAIPARTQFLGLLNNAGHAPIFGAIAWIVWRLTDGWRAQGRARLRHFGATFCAVVLAAAAVEVIQHYIGRDAEAGDVLMSAAGAAFVLCALALWVRTEGGRRTAGRRSLLAAGMVLCAAIVAAPLAEGALAYQRRHAMFPELLRFEHAIGLYFMLGGGVDTRVEPLPKPWGDGHALPALRVQLARTETPGLRLTEPAPDWRGYAALKIEVVNPGEAPLQLMVRVHDAMHDQRHEDRFNLAFTLEARSRRTLAIPLSDIESAPQGRRLDLSQVAGVGLFERSRPAPVGAVFYLTRIWLE